MAKPEESWKLVGKIKDAQGLKGDVFVLIFSGEVSWQTKVKSVLLCDSEGDQQGQLFEIQNLRPHKQGLVVKLKGIENRNQSEELKGKLFLISAEHFVSKKGERIFLYWTAYRIFD